MNPYTRPALIGVPALTLLNPWGLAVTRLGKSPENRTWGPPPDVHRLLIHAGKGDDEAGYEHLVTKLDQRYDQLEAWTVRSAIIAIADLDGVCHVSETGARCQCPPLWAAPGQVHWLLANVVPLPEPVPCRGFQRLWYPTREILDAVAASLATVEWAPIVCRGRRVDGQGKAHGEACGDVFPPAPGETYRRLEQRARSQGWRVAARAEGGPMPDAMCRACALPSDAPTPLELASFAASNRRPA